MNFDARRVGALLATVRIANVPSILGNVALGVFLVGGQANTVSLLITGVCLYFCGGFLNDWADIQWDFKRRPDRALPSGLFSSASYLFFGVALGLFALVIAAVVSWQALSVTVALVLCVVSYTWLHKKTAWSALWMGLCRGLLPLLGWSALADVSDLPAVILAGGSLFFHVLGISLMARRESIQDRAKGRNFAILSYVLATVMMLLCAHLKFNIPMGFAVLGALPYAIWTLHSLSLKGGISAQVAGLLAGIPLVDWMLLLPICLLSVAGVTESVMHGSGWWLWVSPLAFLSGKLLQRYSPAT